MWRCQRDQEPIPPSPLHDDRLGQVDHLCASLERVGFPFLSIPGFRRGNWAMWPRPPFPERDVVAALAARPTALPQDSGREAWSARWISHPHRPPLPEPGVFHLRKVFQMGKPPRHFVVQSNSPAGGRSERTNASVPTQARVASRDRRGAALKGIRLFALPASVPAAGFGPRRLWSFRIPAD